MVTSREKRHTTSRNTTELKEGFKKQVSFLMDISTVADLLSSFGLASILFAAISGGARFWSESNELTGVSSRILFLISILFVFLGLSLKQFRLKDVAIDERGFVCALVLVFFSDWLTRSYNLLQGPGIRGEILLGTLVAYAALKYFGSRFLKYILYFALTLIVGSFLSITAGQLLFSDDNAVFLYRLDLLKSTFPWIPTYDTSWNSGIDSSHLFATGVLNIFLIGSPLIYLFPIDLIYNYLVLTSVILIPCCSTYYAARIEGAPKMAARFSGVLSICLSLFWYRWALKYGTLGFITSASLVPLVLVLVRRLLDVEISQSRKEAFLFILIFSLMLLWSPTLLVFLPALMLAFIKLPILVKKREIYFVLFFLIAINLPWLAMFWHGSKVSRFVLKDFGNSKLESTAQAGSTPTILSTNAFRHRPGKIDYNKTKKVFRENALAASPLMLFLSIPGFFLLQRKKYLFYGATYFWLFILGSLFVPLKPELELDRMLLILLLSLTLPVGLSLAKLLARLEDSSTNHNLFFAALSLGFLFASIFSSSNIVLNRSLEHYYFAGKEVSNVARAIEDKGGEGRILFSGFVLHELSNGHLAPLTYFASKPLFASSHVHNVWKRVEVLPPSFTARRFDGYKEFLELENVSAIFAHEPFWIRYFQSRPEYFREVWRGRIFRLFERKNFVSNYFLQGQGEIIEQGKSGIRLKLLSESAIIKFNYFPFLQVEGCEKIAPHVVSPEINFIELINCEKGRELKIKSKSLLSRIIEGV